MFMHMIEEDDVGVPFNKTHSAAGGGDAAATATVLLPQRVHGPRHPAKKQLTALLQREGHCRL
jgi:hypothetical protein